MWEPPTVQNRHLKGLAPDVPEDFLYTIWSSRLPPNIQAILAGQQECSLDAPARCVDRILEVTPQRALTSVGPPPPPNNTALLQEIENLSCQEAALSTEQDRLRTNFRDPPLSSRDPYSSTRNPRPSPRNRRPKSRSPSQGVTAHTPCYTIAASGPERKSVPRPAPTASRGNQHSRHHRRHMSALR
jgi:hypothetical protein